MRVCCEFSNRKIHWFMTSTRTHELRIKIDFAKQMEGYVFSSLCWYACMFLYSLVAPKLLSPWCKCNYRLSLVVRTILHYITLILVGITRSTYLFINSSSNRGVSCIVGPSRPLAGLSRPLVIVGEYYLYSEVGKSFRFFSDFFNRCDKEIKYI